MPADPNKMLPRDGSPSSAESRPLSSPGSGEVEAPPPALTAAPGLGTLAQAFRRSWKLALSLALLSAVLAAVATWIAVPGEYRSELCLRLTQTAGGDGDVSSDLLALQRAHGAALKSPELITQAMEAARVEERTGMTGNASAVAKKLVIDAMQGPDVMRLTLSGDNPEAVAAILNALGEIYPARIAEADNARLRELIEVDRRKLAVIRERLRDKRVELHAAELKANVDPETRRREEGLAVEELQKTRNRLIDLESKRDALETERAFQEARLKTPGNIEINDTDLDDALARIEKYRDLQKRLTVVDDAIAYINRVYIESIREPKLIEPLKERASIESQLQILRERTRMQLEARRREEDSREARLQLVRISGQLEGVTREAGRLEKQIPDMKIKVDRLNAHGRRVPPDVQQLLDAVDMLEKEQGRVGGHAAELEANLAVGQRRLTKITTAMVPTEKDLGKSLKYSAGVAVGVFMLLAVGVCLLESQSKRISAVDEVSQGLGMPVLGTLPAVSSRVRQLVQGGAPAPENQSGLLEAVDGLRTLLLHSPHAEGARVIVVTSAVAGEGKTTLATHLAASLARAWRKTLLVDCDLRNPNGHRLLNVSQDPGFCEALRGEAEFEDAIRETPISRLWMLPAGNCNAHALQALAQEGIESIFDRFKEEYDFIVIDSSPVLPVPDALHLARCADAVVLSVMRDVSRTPAIYATQQRLRALGVRLLGAVVIGDRSNKYGYGYPYTKKTKK
jgi:capsular exopolysaccharide synthesis family protein